MKMEIEVDESLYGFLSRRAEEKGFESPEEYSSMVLSVVVEELNESSKETDRIDVEDRLEDLGYLN